MRLRGVILLVLLAFPASSAVGQTFTITWTPRQPSAREMAAREARRQVTAAEAAFAKAYSRAIVDHPLMVDVKHARTDLAKARRDLEETRLTFRLAFDKRPEIRKLNLQIRELDEQLASEKTIEKRTNLAKELMQVRAERSKAEATALEADSDFTAAQSAVMEATNTFSMAQQTFTASLMQSPDVVAAKQRLDDARRSMRTIG